VDSQARAYIHPVLENPLGIGPARSDLSRREQEVLEMAARGLSNPQIALRLEVSVHAVKFHLARIYKKLGVTNRTEAAVAYLRSQA
jgi:two-component system, NarL family, nitrate/nitrite response regulator NarL